MSIQKVATMKKFSNFSSEEELVKYAEDLFERKLHHLKNDVEDCLLVGASKTKNAPAPYPAMLFSFSMVDMLGSLHAGSISRADRSYEYMTRVMKVEPRKASILLQIFETKLAHFADPNTIVEYRGSRICWSYFHESDRSRHLEIKQSKKELRYPLTPTRLESDEEFSLGIADFAQDIRNSVYRKPGGFLEILKSPEAQLKFDRALGELLSVRSL